MTVATEVTERLARMEATLSRMEAALKARGVNEDPRYPERMSTSQVAEMCGCSAQTVRTNWQRWGLRLVGRGPYGEMNFQGLSVQRHIDYLNRRPS